MNGRDFKRLSAAVVAVFVSGTFAAPRSAEAASITWDGGVLGADKNWSTGANWAGDAVPASGDTAVFDVAASSATAGTVTNVIDTDRSIAALTYSTTVATNTHTTQIGTTGTGTLSGVNITVGNVAGTTVANIKGGTINGGSLVTSNINSNTSILDMSGLSTLNLTGNILLSSQFANKTTVKMSQTLNQNGGASQAFRFAPRGIDGSSLAFGQTTTLRAGEMTFGAGYSSIGNTIGFRSGLAANPTLFIRGDTNVNNLTRVANGMFVGGHNVNGPNGVTTVMDLTAGGGTDGSIDALVTTLTVGFRTSGVGNNGSTTGTLIYDQGTVDAQTVTLGDTAGTGTGTIAGTITLGGTGSLVADTINLGNNASSNAASISNGVLNVSGGTVKATTLQVGTAAGAGSRSGTVNFNSGKIQNKASTDLTIGSTLTLNSLTSGTHTFEADSGQSITVSGALVGAGTGDVVKAGLGTLNFNAGNTYAGNTLISAGTLALGASGSLTSPSINVASGATYSVGSVSGGYSLNNGQTLKGTGTVTGGLTAASGSIIAPGNSVGTLTMAGVTLSSGSLFNFELATVAASDKVLMTSSTLALNGQTFSNFTFTPLGGFGAGTYVLFDANAVTGSLGGSTTGTVGGFNAALSVQGNDLVLNVTAVPEPGSAMLLLAGIGATSLRRRRKM